MQVARESFQVWPVREFRQVVAHLTAQIVCSSCTSMRKTLFQEVLERSDSEINRDFCLYAKRVYEFIHCPSVFSNNTSCMKEQEIFTDLINRFAKAYPLSAFAPFSFVPWIDRKSSAANVLAYFYFSSIGMASQEAKGRDPICKEDPSLSENILALSRTDAYGKIQELQAIDLLRHLCHFELCQRVATTGSNIRNALAGLAIGAAATVVAGVGLMPTIAILGASTYAGKKSGWILSGTLGKSLPEGLTYTALSDSVFYAYNDYSSGPGGRLIGKASSSYGYLLFKLTTLENGPVAYCEFDLRKPEEPIVANHLTKLADCFREQFEQGVLSYERMQSFITTLRSAKLKDIPLLNETTAVFLMGLLKGEAAFAQVVDELLTRSSALRLNTVGRLKLLLMHYQPHYLDVVEPLPNAPRSEVPPSPHRWPVIQLKALAERVKRVVPCGDCEVKRGQLFLSIIKKSEQELDSEFVSISKEVYEHLFYPSLMRKSKVCCTQCKPLYELFLKSFQQDSYSPLAPLLSSVQALPDLDAGFETPADTARRTMYEKMSSASAVLARMYALSTRLLWNEMPARAEAADLIHMHSRDLVETIATMNPENLVSRQETALLRHHFVLDLFRQAKEQRATAIRVTSSTLACVAATIATGVFMGPLLGALMLLPSYRLTNNIIEILKIEFEKSPKEGLEFHSISSEVSYAYSNSSSGLGGQIKGSQSESFGYLMFTLDEDVLFCPFELYNDEPIAPNELWQLREAFRDKLRQGRLSLPKLRAIIQTLATASLPQSSEELVPSHINKQSTVYLTSLLCEQLNFFMRKGGELVELRNEGRAIRKLVCDAIAADLMVGWPTTRDILAQESC